MDSTDKVMSRGHSENVPEQRSALVQDILAKIAEAETYWSDDFKQMRRDMDFASGKQWPDQSADDERYVVNVTGRHLQQRTSQLYARNPTIICKPKPLLHSVAWDGSPESLMAAQMAIQSGVAGEGEVAVLAEAQQMKMRLTMLRRQAQTLQLVMRHEISEPKPSFKSQTKQAVRRALTCGVAYGKVGYRRLSQYPPETASQIVDDTKRLAEIERLLADMADGEIEQLSKEAEELKVKLAHLQTKRVLLREGLVFGFPRATQILVDPDCTQLKGFVDASWVAEKFIFTLNKVKEKYGIDLKGSKYVAYDDKGGKLQRKNQRGHKPHACVYEFYDLVGQIMYTVCEGYNDFLKEPGDPNVDLPEQFHPFFVLSFNDSEDDQSIYPQSNVSLICNPNREINRSREALRDHRIAARPATVGAKGALSEIDKDKMSTHAVGEHIELSVPADTDITKVMQAKPTMQIDPNLYEVGSFYEDILRVTGDQAANLGGTSGDTATESSIAESSRMSSLDSNKDDLNDWLNEMFAAAAQVVLREMDPSTVLEIVGPGAVWPQLSREEVAKELSTEILAGSSGRPNRAMDLAMLERVGPTLVQVPGISPTALGRRIVPLAFEDADLDEWIVEGLPSIQAINGMAKTAAAPGMSDPNLQGEQGGNNEEQPPGPEGVSQGPANPIPTGEPGVRMNDQQSVVGAI